MKKPVSAIATAFLALSFAVLPGQSAVAASETYTTNADFDEGVYNNVVHSTPDQLQLDETVTAFPFIWVALSDRGTIAKIDTVTGAVKGEYSTTSDGDDGHNPSRTTVANDGSVWAGNRNQSSVIHVGSLDAGGCVDRNGNGTIETSSGYGDVLAWPGGASGSSAPVSDAADECILHYVDTAPNGYDARHVSIDADGNVWVGAFGVNDWTQHEFQLINGTTGAILRTVTMPCGGYGGLIDGNGVLWSSTSGELLRWDPDTDPSTATCLPLGIYGLAFDSTNHIWASTLGSGVVYKVAPDGLTWQSFPQGHPDAQGLAVDGNDHVWISNSLFAPTNSISHLKNDGTLVGSVTGSGGGSTGVSVDAAGKIWTANINSSDATRIDPTAGPLGSDGVTPIGAFDLTVPLPGANPYNYSDMTGSTLTGKPNSGTWTVVYDSGEDSAEWGAVDWTADVPSDSALTVRVSSSNDNVTFSADQSASAGADLTVPNGRYLKVVVGFVRASTGESPILYDLSVNTAETCSYSATFLQPLDGSSPSGEVTNTIKNGRVVPVKVSIVDTCTGAALTDPEADVTIELTRVLGAPGGTDPVETYADAGASSAGTDSFRFTDGFWIYNLDTKALGLIVGNTYRIDVYVGGTQVTVDSWALIRPTK